LLAATTFDVELLMSSLKVGFRRIGQSEYFAYALADKNHPSHQLAIEDDAVWLVFTPHLLMFIFRSFFVDRTTKIQLPVNYLSAIFGV
jgi:hypothetical protein